MEGKKIILVILREIAKNKNKKSFFFWKLYW